MAGNVHSGGCNCGRIRYQFEGEPQAVVACHCLNCQRQGGAAFSINLLLPDDRLAITGDLKVYTDGDTESGKPVYRHFCPDCGSPIISRSDQVPGLSIVKAGTLDERHGFEPQMHCWTDTAFDWFQLPEGMPASPRNPEIG